jgi:uncharacterized protein
MILKTAMDTARPGLGPKAPREAGGRSGLPDRYGGWALIAGASEGLGAAWARALADRGLNLILVARRSTLLDRLAEDVRRTSAVEVRCREGDLAATDFLESLRTSCSGLGVGFVVYNATQAPVGDFASADDEALMRVVDVNVRAPLMLLRGFLPAMRSRGRGAVVLMTSLAGNQGSPKIAAYAASKAFTRVLAEGLWHELKDDGVDVIACCAGAVRTPGYAQAAGKDAPGTLDPEEVVERAIRALGRGPVVVPGFVNRVADVLMRRLLPRRAAIAIMAGNTASLTSVKVPAFPAGSPVDPAQSLVTTAAATRAAATPARAAAASAPAAAPAPSPAKQSRG